MYPESLTAILDVLVPDHSHTCVKYAAPPTDSSVSDCSPWQAVKVGDIVFVGQYLFTGSETTSVWLTVRQNQPTTNQ